MFITRTIQVDFDEAAERQRLMNSFTATTRDNLLQVLAQFVSGAWHDAWRQYQMLKRADRELAHPLIVECLTGFATRHGLDGVGPAPKPGPYAATQGFHQRIPQPGYPEFAIGGNPVTLPEN